MKKEFTKKDLLTGDIIETRNGDRGVVILEKDCILYPSGGLDCLDVFTEDLFVDGTERSGDIFKVYRDDGGPIGFQKLYDAYPVFRRINNKYTKERAAELDDKYDQKKGKAVTVVLDPFKRKCMKEYIDIFDKNKNDTNISPIDVIISEAPSMTVCGQLKADKTFIPIPETDHLFLIYNRFQEEWKLENMEQDRKEQDRMKGFGKDTDPVIVIPERDLSVYSRCMIVRKNDSGELEDIQDDDIEKIKGYLFHMQLPGSVEPGFTRL